MGKTSNENNLSKEDIGRLYNYLCRYEREIKYSYGHFDFNDIGFQEFCKENQIAPKNGRSHLPNKFAFHAEKPKRAQINDMAHHLLRHIRNAIAHGLVTKKGKMLYWKDYNVNMKETMNGQIREDLFWSFLKRLIETKR